MATIIIGIGSSGMHVLSHVQKYHYEWTRNNKPRDVSYLFIETDANSKPDETPVGNAIKPVYLNMNDLAIMRNHIPKTCGDMSWLPTEANIHIAGAGAGGVRNIGRLALWGTNNHQANFTTVINAITYAHQEIYDVAQNADIFVYIVGSLTGGTGSGIVIDIPYMVKDTIPNSKIFGLFLLPPNPATGIVGRETMYKNTYGALIDIDYYNQPDTRYQFRWPNGTNVNYSEPPYELIQFISQDFNDGAPSMPLNALYKMAGMYLTLLTLHSGNGNENNLISNARYIRLIDAMNNGQVHKYGTFGFSAIHFPKEQIEEYIACELAKNLINQTINNNSYFPNGSTFKINEPKILEEAENEWNLIIDRVMDRLNSAQNRHFLREIKQKAVQINKEEIVHPPFEEIRELFISTDNINNHYYALLRNEMRSIREFIYDEIKSAYEEKVNSKESLIYGKLFIENMKKSIENTIKYWHSIDIPQSPQGWNNRLMDRINKILSYTKSFKWMFEHDNILEEQLLDLLNILKMHLLLPVLQEVTNQIEQDIIHQNGVKIQKFRDIIEGLETRQKTIREEVEDHHIPIHRIFNRDFENDWKSSLDRFERNNGNIRSVSELVREIDIEEEENINLQNLLDLTKENDNSILTKIVNKYKIKVKNAKCVDIKDVITYILENKQQARNVATRSRSPLLRFRNNIIFNHLVYVPRFIIASNMSSVKDVIDAIQLTEYPNHPNNQLEVPNLQNIVIFYHERGNISEGVSFNLLNDLSYSDQMREIYLREPNAFTSPLN